MDIPSGKWSTGALMRVIVPIALQLVVFQEVWGILLMPPVTIAMVTLNLALSFVLVRPRSWQTRILGMLLGGCAAIVVSIIDYAISIHAGPPGTIGRVVAERLASWAAALPESGEGLATLLQLIVRHAVAIEAMLLDIIGLAAIWAGGRLDHRCRLRAGRRAAGAATPAVDHESAIAP